MKDVLSFSSSLQLQCEWAQVQVVVLHNDGNGFGFGISGSRNSGPVVRNLFPGGAADRVSERRTGKASLRQCNGSDSLGNSKQKFQLNTYLSRFKSQP